MGRRIAKRLSVRGIARRWQLQLVDRRLSTAPPCVATRWSLVLHPCNNTTNWRNDDAARIYLAKVLWAAVLASMFLGAVPPVRADQAADEAAIRANAAKYVESYNRRDSKTMASMWSPEAVYTDDSTGERRDRPRRDRQAARPYVRRRGRCEAQGEYRLDRLRVAECGDRKRHGRGDVSESPTEKTEYTAVHVKRDGKWLLDRVTETEIDEKPTEPPPSNYEHLKELEWMIGSWIDQGRKCHDSNRLRMDEEPQLHDALVRRSSSATR